MLTPTRRRDHEILDDPSTDPALAIRSLHDVAQANRWFGGKRTIVRAVRRVLQSETACGAKTPALLLDIGTGLGDIPYAAQRMSANMGRQLHTVGLERIEPLSRSASAQCHTVVTGDALSLPFATNSVDVITCSQVLHHFDGAQAEQLLRECHRVARTAVIIGDLRRSWLAVGGLWLSSFFLGFHPVSRHDGIVSIKRGYTTSELFALIELATGCQPTVARALGWRVTATWFPHHATNV